MKSTLAALAAATLCFVASEASAVTIDFEVAVSENVTPTSPYSEDGFTFTPSNTESAVFTASEAFMTGNSTGAFGFAGGNTITLTDDGGDAFDLYSLLIGPGDYAVTPTNVTVFGFYEGGGFVTSTFSNLATATPATLGWTDLSSVIFSATTDSALDDLLLNEEPVVGEVPLPASGALLALGLAGVAALRRTRAAA